MVLCRSRLYPPSQGLRIWPQYFSGTGSGSGSVSRDFMNRNFKIFQLEKNHIFLVKNYLQASRRTSFLQEKPPVLKREYPLLQNKYGTFLNFPSLWGHFAHLDPDPVKSMRIHANPYPQQISNQKLFRNILKSLAEQDICVYRLRAPSHTIFPIVSETISYI